MTFKIITFLLNYCVKKLSKFESKQTGLVMCLEAENELLQEQIESNEESALVAHRERMTAANLRKKIEDLS